MKKEISKLIDKYEADRKESVELNKNYDLKINIKFFDEVIKDLRTIFNKY